MTNLYLPVITNQIIIVHIESETHN